ncbi:hypothetical protein QVD17_27804 [Tagetes erecta]|uniref:Uncharacterized protein n=1 Tax=Tagetes erecta TaxID=13708 RepID=A0AAD8K983_TARER|nr:hypothetical protein QVD17_27804 [Tagetes erecta]
MSLSYSLSEFRCHNVSILYLNGFKKTKCPMDQYEIDLKEKKQHKNRQSLLGLWIAIELISKLFGFVETHVVDFISFYFILC